jgi:hypothetical protein
MDLGRKPLARFPFGDVEISEETISNEHIEQAVAQLGVFGTDNRAGINATLHRISCLRNRRGEIIGLTARVGRSIPGTASMITDLAVAGYSILLLGRPGELLGLPFPCQNDTKTACSYLETPQYSQWFFQIMASSFTASAACAIERACCPMLLLGGPGELITLPFFLWFYHDYACSKGIEWYICN